MIFTQFLFYIFIFHPLEHHSEATVADYFKKVFSGSNHTTTTTAEISLDIIISKSKRDVGSPYISDTLKSNSEVKCSDEPLKTVLAELQTINLENIINLSTQDDLNTTCNKVATAFGAELKNCTLADEASLYQHLTKGVIKLYDILCLKESKLKEDFKRHFPCLRELHSDFETCYGPPDWMDSGVNNETCRILRQISDCYYTKAIQLCGADAAYVMRKLIDQVSNSALPVHCHGERKDVESKSTKENINKRVFVLMVILNLWYVQKN